DELDSRQALFFQLRSTFTHHDPPLGHLNYESPRLTRYRLHQAPLRDAALKRYGAQCMYCGLEVPEILEAAHIIPDSEGGAASTENIRVLCANHHIAFDAKLIILVDGELAPAPGAPEVPPLPAGEAAV
ncbi:MAG: hypothetical protein DI611_06405, partial [Brachybacterium faecium]